MVDSITDASVEFQFDKTKYYFENLSAKKLKKLRSFDDSSSGTIYKPLKTSLLVTERYTTRQIYIRRNSKFFYNKALCIRNINTDKFYKFMGGQSLHDGSAVDLKNPATILKWALMISLPIPFNFALHLGTLTFHLNPRPL